MSAKTRGKLRRISRFAVHGLVTEDEERWWALPLDRAGLPVSDETAGLSWPGEDYARAAAKGAWPRATEVCADCWQPMGECQCGEEQAPKAGKKEKRSE